jgi:hypothetical protein
MFLLALLVHFEILPLELFAAYVLAGSVGCLRGSHTGDNAQTIVTRHPFGVWSLPKSGT